MKLTKKQVSQGWKLNIGTNPVKKGQQCEIMFDDNEGDIMPYRFKLDWDLDNNIFAYRILSDVKNDNVNNPSHYTSGAIECIDAIEASMSKEAFLGYLKGNALKYTWRYEQKLNPKEDLQKAQWYLNKLIEKTKK